MAWPLGAAADFNFIMDVEDKLKETYNAISPSSISGAPLRQRLEDAIKHVATFKLRAVSAMLPSVRERSQSSNSSNLAK
jgi:hypothetical protein